MKKIRTVIVDDETPARDRLRSLLAPFPDVEIVGEAADGEEALEVIAEAKPDLVLLDIQMPGCSGMEVAASLPSGGPQIVFCTAFDQYAIQAFDVQAVDYLLKPVNRVRLARTLDRIREGNRQTENLEKTLQRVAPTRFLGKKANRYRTVSADDVLCFYSDGGLTQVWTAEFQLWMDPSLNDLEGRLDPERFYRISRQALINLDRVEEVVPLIGGHGQVRLKGGKVLDVSRRRMAGLVQKLGGE